VQVHFGDFREGLSSCFLQEHDSQRSLWSIREPMQLHHEAMGIQEMRSVFSLQHIKAARALHDELTPESKDGKALKLPRKLEGLGADTQKYAGRVAQVLERLRASFATPCLDIRLTIAGEYAAHLRRDPQKSDKFLWAVSDILQPNGGVCRKALTLCFPGKFSSPNRGHAPNLQPEDIVQDVAQKGRSGDVTIRVSHLGYDLFAEQRHPEVCVDYAEQLSRVKERTKDLAAGLKKHHLIQGLQHELKCEELECEVIGESPAQSTNKNVEWGYWVASWGAGQGDTPEGDIVFHGGHKGQAVVEEKVRGPSRINLGMFGQGGLATKLMPRGEQHRVISQSVRMHVHSYEIQWVARLIWQLCLFADLQYGRGDGVWADRVFTGNGDAWALRTFSNKFVLCLCAVFSLLEYFMLGHHCPWYTAAMLMATYLALRLLQITGAL